MAHPSDVFEPGSTRAPQLGLLPLFSTMLIAGLAICLFDLADARSFLGDIDDQLREVQIRHLLFGGGTWWDLGLPMIATPEPYLSPWSRLVDLPYVALTALFTLLVGKEQALLLAFDIWPPMMLAIFCLQTALVFRRLGVPASPFGYLIVVTSGLLMVFALWEFVPGRIDHHNAQLIALMTMICGLAHWGRWGGRWIGLGAVVSVTIALEGLPFIVIVFAGLVLALLARAAEAAAVVRNAGATMVFACLPMAYAMLGPAGSMSTQCDAFSAPYVFLLVGFGAILWVVARFLPQAKWWVQCLAMSLPALVVAAGFTAMFPQCLAGPYWMVDPLSKAYWLDRVSQEHSALYFIEQGQTAIVVLAVLLASILTFATAVAIEYRQRRWAGLFIMLALAWAALILTLLLNRYIRFAFAFAPLFLPSAMQYFIRQGADAALPLVKRAVIACVIGYFLIASWLVVVTPARTTLLDAVEYMAYDECKEGDFSSLKTLSAGGIVAPQGLALPLLSVLPPGLSVAAIPFHRAAPGMKRVFEAFLTSDPAIRRQALAPFAYVAICRFPLDTETGTAPLYDALSKGGDWPGLARLDTGAGNPFQLFRIDHESLR